MKLFKRSNLAIIGTFLLFAGLCCDPDRSSIPAMVAMIVIGGALCLAASHEEEYGYEEDADCDFDCDDYDIPDRRACR